MRLDYILYVSGALVLVVTVVPFIITIDGMASDARNLWVVSTLVIGLLSIGLGYSQRPKTTAQACQLSATMASETVAGETHETVIQKPPAATIEAPAATATALELTQVKGIGEKRAAQLKALGINNVSDLAKASAEDIAEKLQISPKITQKWIDNAQELVK